MLSVAILVSPVRAIFVTVAVVYAVLKTFAEFVLITPVVVSVVQAGSVPLNVEPVARARVPVPLMVPLFVMCPKQTPRIPYFWALCHFLLLPILRHAKPSCQG